MSTVMSAAAREEEDEEEEVEEDNWRMEYSHQTKERSLLAGHKAELYEKKKTILVRFVVCVSPQLEFSLSFQHVANWLSCYHLWFELAGGDGQEDKLAPKVEWSLETQMKKSMVSGADQSKNLDNKYCSKSF